MLLAPRTHHMGTGCSQGYSLSLSLLYPTTCLVVKLLIPAVTRVEVGVGALHVTASLLVWGFLRLIAAVLLEVRVFHNNNVVTGSYYCYLPVTRFTDIFIVGHSSMTTSSQETTIKMLSQPQNPYIGAMIGIILIATVIIIILLVIIVVQALKMEKLRQVLPQY